MLNDKFKKAIDIASNIPGNVIVYCINKTINDNEIIYISEDLNKLFNYPKDEFDILKNNKTLIKSFFESAEVTSNDFVYGGTFNIGESHTYRLNTPTGFVWIRVISKVIDHFEDCDVVITLLSDISKETKGFEFLLETNESLYVVYSEADRKVLYCTNRLLKLFNKTKLDSFDKEVCKLFNYNNYEDFEENVINYNKENENEYIKLNDKYYDIEKINIIWRDVKGYALIMHDVTNVVKQSQKMIEAYKNQISSFMNASSESFLMASIDLIDNSVNEYYELYNDRIPHNALEALEYIKSDTIKSKFNATFFDKFTTDYFMEQYELGKKSLQFLITKFYNESLCFCEIKINFIKNPISNHLEAYINEKNATAQEMDKYINKAIVNEKCESIGIISPTSKRIFFYKYNYDEYFEDNKCDYEYEDGIRMVAYNLLDSYRIDSFISNNSLDNIVRKLEVMEGKYSFISRIKKSGIDNTIAYGYVRISYFYADKKNGFIIFMIEDLTKEIELDPVTNHINRPGFLKQVNNLLKSKYFNKEDYSLVYFNIIGFKAINRNFGHEKGDDILRHILLELLNSRLEPLVISRLDADNFALLVNKSNIDYDYIASLTYVYYLKEFGEIRLRCGIYNLLKDDKNDASSMYDRAKLAVDSYFTSSLNNVVVFDEYMANDYISRNDVLADFNEALDNEEFQIYYQPVVDSKTGEIISAEALVRWKKKNGKIISPGLFIPVIEEAGYITKLDLYVINHTIDFIKQRKESGKKVIPISINMSRKDFFDDDIIDICNKKINELSYFNMLRIEITESDYVDIQAKGKEFLSNIRNNGGNILLDDFGKGASSFSTLRDYDFDILKLDLGFIRRIGASIKNDKIITSVLEMAKCLDLKVIAEGVETQEQVDFLKKNKCDYFQGYYYYRPIPEEEFEKLLN